MTTKKEKKSSMAIKPEGGGGKALMALPLREELFFAASLRVVFVIFKEN